MVMRSIYVYLLINIKKRVQQNTATIFEFSDLVLLIWYYLHHFHSIEQITVNQNTSTVLAHDDLFALADLALALRRNGIEATTACITLNSYHAQTIAVIFADAVVGVQQALFYFFTG